jgi:hypothetical protein
VVTSEQATNRRRAAGGLGTAGSILSLFFIILAALSFEGLDLQKQSDISHHLFAAVGLLCCALVTAAISVGLTGFSVGVLGASIAVNGGAAGNGVKGEN